MFAYYLHVVFVWVFVLVFVIACVLELLVCVCFVFILWILGLDGWFSFDSYIVCFRDLIWIGYAWLI